jgi:hypothetical protein
MFMQMPLSDEVSRDTEYHETGQDQQRHRASDAAVQTIAREMTAHGLNPLMRSFGVMVSGMDGSTPLPVRASARWCGRC